MILTCHIYTIKQLKESLRKKDVFKRQGLAQTNLCQ